MKLGQQDTNLTKELCLVRMFKEQEVHTSLRCLELKWVEDGLASYKAIVIIASILKVIHIIPHFDKDGHYFVNTFKF